MYRNLFKYLALVLYVGFVSLCMVSCEKVSPYAQTFELKDAQGCNWDSLINVESVVQLQENDSCLMSYDKKCLITDHYIIFWDYKAKRIYSFSREGKFLCQIGRLGHAVSEYMEIMDVCMAEKDSAVMLLDGRGILYYHPRTGKFITRKKFSSPNFGEYEQAVPVESSAYLCYSDSRNSNSIVLDTPRGQQGLRKSKRYHFGVNYFYQFNGSYRVISDYGDFYIDKYENRQLKTLYKIDLGSQALPDDIRQKTFEEFNAVDNAPDYFKCITDACETNNMLYLGLIGPHQERYIAFINKDSGSYVFTKDERSLGMYVVCARGNDFYALIYPDSASPSSFAKKVLAKFHVSSSDSRPVVVKFRIYEKLV